MSDTRKLTVRSCEPFRSGTTRGRDWTIFKLEVENVQGQRVDQDFVSFDRLPVDELRDFEVDRKEREFKGRTYVSYQLRLPKTKNQELPDLPLVPDGRYAVQIDDEWKLYRIWRGTRNPSIQHAYAVKGTEDGQRVFGREYAEAVKAIATDPGEAAIQFGHRTGHCSRCGTELAKNLSRHMGIGPDCVKHWFPTDVCNSKRARSRSALRAIGVNPEGKFDDITAAALVAA